ncbi:hypothetical protein [Verrucomicrobium sp. BvORR034]|uniref:hypothetical protein n=1 Tax=Verrucomicrobium sp. BvORR034 TaxID=1396418 RepID=UPI0006792FA9|nr:hypothetical protein [Verrucomicrobium sp. BvORR034]
MNDYTVIGSTPCDEDCQQVGAPDYDRAAAIAECKRFRDLIREHCGEEPEGARLIIKGETHEFGTYHEVHCVFNDNIDLAVDYAFHVETHAPAKWDGSGARRWLSTSQAEPQPS